MAKKYSFTTARNTAYHIKSKAWRSYTEKLRTLSKTASKELEDYIRAGHTEKEVLDYAYALVTKYGEASSELTCQMYEAIAAYSGAEVAAAEPAATATYGETARSISGAMMRTKDAAAISSSAGRLVKLASVDTMMKNALRDGAEWAWIPQGDTCAFCRMLASRGWVRASEKAIKKGHAEHIHNNCDCTYCVRFDHETTVEGYDPDALYEEYINAGDTKWERINAMRRQHYAANKDAINAQKRAAYARQKALLHNSSPRSIINIKTGGQRNEEPLTHAQIEECIAFAETLGIPRERIAYSENYWTSYNPALDILLLGTDAYPNSGAKSYNGRLNYRCAIAHELVGHREACLRGKTNFPPKDVRDEAQASIRAARFTPGLDTSERIMLLRDAIERLHKRGIKVRDIKDMLDITER